MIPLPLQNQSSYSTKRIVAWLELFYHSHLVIAAAAAALSYETFWLFPGLRVNKPLAAVFLFVCTFCFYGLHDLFTKITHSEQPSTPNRGWLWKNNTLLQITILVLSMALLPFLAWQTLGPRQLWIFGIGGLITIAYSFPVIPSKKIRRWKENSTLKITILAGIWSAITVLLWLPKFLPHTLEFLGLFAFRYVYVLLICIPFDVRDNVADRLIMKSTLVDRFSIKGMHYLSYLCTIVAIALIIAGYMYNSLGIITALLLIAHTVYTLWLVNYSIKNTELAFNYFWLDTQLILQALIVGLSVWLTYIR